MDAEWEGILATVDDEEEDSDDDEEEEDEVDDLMLTDEELLAADATEGGYLGGEGEDGQEDEEGEEGGGLRGGPGQAKRRKPRVWYDSYKARMKAEKAKAAAWQEKRKTFSKAHNDYLDEAQRNREIAAARYTYIVCTPAVKQARFFVFHQCDVTSIVARRSLQTGHILQLSSHSN